MSDRWAVEKIYTQEDYDALIEPMRCGHLSANFDGSQGCIVCPEIARLTAELEAAKFNVVTLNSMNADYAKRERESLARAEAAERRCADLERAVEAKDARLALAERVIKTADAYDSFDCPHFAEDRCKCGLTQTQLEKEWNIAKIAYDSAPAPQIAGEAKPEPEETCEACGYNERAHWLGGPHSQFTCVQFQPTTAPSAADGKPCGYCACGHASADHFFDAPHACNFGHPCRCDGFKPAASGEAGA